MVSKAVSERSRAMLDWKDGSQVLAVAELDVQGRQKRKKKKKKQEDDPAGGRNETRARWGGDTIRERGRCSLSSETCGKKGGVFGTPLPCVHNDLASKVDSATAEKLESVCGPELAAQWLEHGSGATCCDVDALDKLSSSLQQAQAFIALCPACSKSFTSFYCHFTCSPDQSTFVTVSEVQDLGDSKGPAVKALQLHVNEEFGSSFYDACKDVKFAATNGLAMEFIGGGAKDWLSFLTYMGKERPGLGSPFQIDFPQPPNVYNGTMDDLINPLNPASLSCASPDPAIGCACADCPARCLSLPPLPDSTSHCHVGALTCSSFFLVIAYSILLLSFMLGIGIRDLWSRRHVIFANRSSGGGRIQLPVSPSDYDRLDMTDPLAPEDESQSRNQGSRQPGSRWTSAIRGLVGSGSTAQAYDGDSMTRSSSTRRGGETSTSSSGHLPDSDSNHTLSRPRLGRGASLLSPDALTAYSQPRTYRLNTIFTNAFYCIGLACAKYPYITIVASLVICGALNAGWSKFTVEKDPVRLWVARDSQLAAQKETFDRSFGPFYRTEQVFLSRDGAHKDQPVLDWEVVKWWNGVEQEIQGLSTASGTYLKDICFAPLAESFEARQSSDCTVQSFLGYFGGTLDKVNADTWADELNYCARTPTECLSPAGQPLNPRLLFGEIPDYSGHREEQQQQESAGNVAILGLEGKQNAADSFHASEARAVVVTYVVNNSLDPSVVRRAEEWENTLRAFLSDKASEAEAMSLRLTFSTGTSLEQELNKSTNTDVPIVVLSYLVMFFYVSVSLGGTLGAAARLIWLLLLRLIKATNLRRKASHGAIALDDPQNHNHHTGPQTLRSALHDLFVGSKFSLALVGMAIVLLSVVTSVAICSMFGVRVTLIIAEVIPFLILAIGVDNVFILAHELERQNSRAYTEALLDEEDGDDPLQAPDSIALATPPQERVARAVGRMGPSIFLSASCQGVAFALGATVSMPAVRNFAIYAAGAVGVNAVLQMTLFVAVMTLDLKRQEAQRLDCFPCAKFSDSSKRHRDGQSGLLARFIRSVYAPSLLHKRVKIGVTIVFSALFVASWICTDYVQLGLDQRLALPRKSYLVDYFDDLDAYLDVGPPVYFVVQDVDVTHRKGQQDLCGRFSTCDQMSLANVLEAERKRPSQSYLAETPAVWLDDFFQWLNPALEACCSVKRRHPEEFCTPDDSELTCRPCYQDGNWNITMEGLPEGAEFLRYLQEWVQAPTNADCALGGKAGYSSAIRIDASSHGKERVSASHFRTYHTPMKSQDDYINSLASAKRIAAEIAQHTGGNVFPYSIFYVFFEQYATIVTTTRLVIAMALLAVFLTTSIMLGSLRTGSMVLICVLGMVMNVAGVMGIWHISLNAISLVNLVISVGIGVEFCAHVARAFTGAAAATGSIRLPHSHPAAQRERDERAFAALVDVGPSVFSGITMTKLIGISVLALTRSRLLQTYYFRMWLTLIVSGALHGLVLLPVLLSFQGGSGYSLNDKDEQQYIEEIARYRGRPLLVEGDEDGIGDSDDDLL